MATGTTNHLIQSIDKKYKILEPSLSPLKFKDRRLRTNVQKLKRAAKAVAIFAGQYDYEGVEANGYWTFVRIVDKFTQVALDSFAQHGYRNYDKRLDTISNGLVKYSLMIEMLRKATGPHDDNENATEVKLKLSTDSFDTTLACLRQLVDMQYEQSVLHGYYPCFWLCPSVGDLQSKGAMAMALLSNLPFSVKALWNKSYRGRAIARCQVEANSVYPAVLANLADLEIVKMIRNFVHRKRDKYLDVRTVHVPRQSTYVLPSNGKVVQACGDKLSWSQTENIECRYIKDMTRINKTNSIVLYFHGGAFMCYSAEASEPYLRQWAHRMDGVPFLSVEYSKKQPYPTAFQQGLDVYLWLASGLPEVKRKLGFLPERIILCGESAGACLATALCFMVHDVKEIVLSQEGETPLMPAALVTLVHGFRSVSTSPSKVLMAGLDPILTTGTYLMSYSSLVTPTADSNQVSVFSLMENPFSNFPFVDQIAYVAAKIYKDLSILGSVVSGLGGAMPWYRKHNFHAKECLRTMEEIFSQSPYLSPVAQYKNFNAIKGTALHLITTHFDSSLDDSVTLAKAWPGHVTFKVLDDLPHTFPAYFDVSDEAKAASDYCVARLLNYGSQLIQLLFLSVC
ncbi:Hormone-sensitive lipase [Halotydeus destructor]|nr:Hormone-sensitive lipase [Halotydeus destructor]